MERVFFFKEGDRFVYYYFFLLFEGKEERRVFWILIEWKNLEEILKKVIGLSRNLKEFGRVEKNFKKGI